MKIQIRSLIAITALVSALSLQADIPTSRIPISPGQINYQGRLTTPAGAAYTNGVYNIEFRMWNASLGGTTPLWGAKYIVYAKDGYFNVILGSSSGMTLTTNVPTYPPQELWKALWYDTSESGATANERYLGITVLQDSDGNNLPAAEIQEAFPRQRLLSAPFAERAEFAQYARQAEDTFHVPSVLSVGGAVVASNNVSVMGNSVCFGNTAAGGLLTCSNGITVKAGMATMNQGLLIMNNGADITGGVRVAGQAQLKGGVVVTGNSTISGTETIGGALDVTGQSQLRGGATITGHNLVSGSNTVSGNLNVQGTYLVNGSLPFAVYRYVAPANLETWNFDTTFACADWSALVVGFDFGTCDCEEANANEYSWKVLMVKGANAKWWITCEGHTHGNHPDYIVDVLYIKKTLVNDYR